MAYSDQKIDPDKGSQKTLIFVHGRSWKPQAEQLKELVRSAILAGIKRDGEQEQQQQFQELTIELVYFGDLTNALLTEAGCTNDHTLDLADRKNTLAELSMLTKSKQFRRPNYETLPGRNSWKEFIADIGAPIMSALRLTDVLLSKSMPEVVAYWNRESDFHKQVTERMNRTLLPALERGDDILVIAHCLGSVIAYDTLWSLSRKTNKKTSGARKVHTFLTIGSPLGDEFVKSKLADRDATEERRYPDNLVNWFNVAAEDDYTCHDESVANDFKKMLARRLLSRIKDYRIYNLAVRYGRSNPHNATGYLTHPRVTKLISDWL